MGCFRFGDTFGKIRTLCASFWQAGMKTHNKRINQVKTLSSLTVRSLLVTHILFRISGCSVIESCHIEGLVNHGQNFFIQTIQRLQKANTSKVVLKSQCYGILCNFFNYYPLASRQIFRKSVILLVHSNYQVDHLDLYHLRSDSKFRSPCGLELQVIHFELRFGFEQILPFLAKNFGIIKISLPRIHTVHWLHVYQICIFSYMGHYKLNALL